MRGANTLMLVLHNDTWSTPGSLSQPATLGPSRTSDRRSQISRSSESQEVSAECAIPSHTFTASPTVYQLTVANPCDSSNTESHSTSSRDFCQLMRWIWFLPSMCSDSVQYEYARARYPSHDFQVVSPRWKTQVTTWSCLLNRFWILPKRDTDLAIDVTDERFPELKKMCILGVYLDFKKTIMVLYYMRTFKNRSLEISLHYMLWEHGSLWNYSL